jgi:hypothetical protein
MVSRGNTIPTKRSSAPASRGHPNARRSGHSARRRCWPGEARSRLCGARRALAKFGQTRSSWAILFTEQTGPIVLPYRFQSLNAWQQALRLGQECREMSVIYWSERRDLNSGPPVPQTGALTGLRYAPNIGPHYSHRGLSPQHAPVRRCRTARLAAP